MIGDWMFVLGGRDVNGNTPAPLALNLKSRAIEHFTCAFNLPEDFVKFAMVRYGEKVLVHTGKWLYGLTISETILPMKSENVYESSFVKSEKPDIEFGSAKKHKHKRRKGRRGSAVEMDQSDNGDDPSADEENQDISDASDSEVVNTIEASKTVGVSILAQVPAADEDHVQEPVAEEPVTEEPVAEEPAVEEPVAEEPAVEEPAVEEPVAEAPAAEEPVAEEPEEENLTATEE